MAEKHVRSKSSNSSLSRAGGYPSMLADIKQRIRTAQVRASLSVNRELILLYWDIGRSIVLKQSKEGWGSGVIDRLSLDIQKEFPGIEGFSRTNVYRMRSFYLAYRTAGPIVPQPARQLPSKQTIVAQPAQQSGDKPVCQSAGRRDSVIVSQPARQLEAGNPPEPMASLPWFHNVILIETVSDPTARLWYAQQAVKNGWSRSMLQHWIDSDLYARQGKAANNFKTTLPAPQSDLARQLLKDPYNFDFLTLHTDAMERELEEGLMGHITRFLLEMGEGFAFVGRQVHLEVDGEDFYIDLLFYHLHLRAFVVIDLKAGKFTPEYAGKMNFYLSAVDNTMRKAGDASSIGLILCKTRSKVIAEYALRHLGRPVGVAQYITRLTEELPRELAGQLPTVKEIEAELSRPKKSRQGCKKEGVA